jgi:hypothetical protein
VSNNGRSGGLFQPANKSQRFLKVLLTGTFGTGKTRAALSFPRPIAVLDLEGGTALYNGDFDVLRTKDLKTIEQAIDSLASSAYKTVVIDPITIIYTLLQDAAQTLVERRNSNQPTIETGKSLTPREWGMIKREYNALLTKLINLPMHVVLVTREKDLYEGTGDNMRKIGVQPDTEKGTPYLADFVLHMMNEGRNGEVFYAIVEKSRSDLLPKGKRLEGYTSDGKKGLYPLHLAAVASEHTQGGAAVHMEDDSAAAARNADVLAQQEQSPVATSHSQTSTEALAKSEIAIMGEFARIGLNDHDRLWLTKAANGGRTLDQLGVEDRRSFYKVLTGVKNRGAALTFINSPDAWHPEPAGDTEQSAEPDELDQALEIAPDTDRRAELAAATSRLAGSKRM